MTRTTRPRPGTGDDPGEAGARVDAPSPLYDVVSGASTEGFVIFAADGRLVAWNDRVFELWGLDPAARERIRALRDSPAAPAPFTTTFSSSIFLPTSLPLKRH